MLKGIFKTSQTCENRRLWKRVCLGSDSGGIRLPYQTKILSAYYIMGTGFRSSCVI